jgi:predicted Fe-Mo cluster-binding NifX family protein
MRKRPNASCAKKLNHQHFANEAGHGHENSEHRHGFSPEEKDRHTQMIKAIEDCQVVICGGMGAGAYVSIRSQNIQPILTKEHSIEKALQMFLAGTLVNYPEKLH